jgi:hypothetical protein
LTKIDSVESSSKDWILEAPTKRREAFARAVCFDVIVNSLGQHPFGCWVKKYYYGKAIASTVTAVPDVKTL